MPRVLGFKKLFAERVRLGMKRQTVRAPSRMLPAAGDERMFYSGLRTRQCRPVFPQPVTIRPTRPVRLRFAPPYHLTAVALHHDGRWTEEDPEDFALADGFDYLAMRAKGAWMPDRKAYWVGEHPADTTADVMGCWFRHAHPKAFEAGVFEGVVLFWEPPVRVHSEAEYRETFGEPIEPVDYRHIAIRRGWRSSGGDGELPPDLPADLREALGTR